MDATTTSLADDLQDLQLERTVTKALKSAEELDRLTVDEQLSGIERAVYLLSSSGQEVQRISVIASLPDLLRDSNAECMRRVVPKVREVLHVAQAEMQLAASTAFLQILQKELVPIQNYTQTFLQTILTSVDSKDPDVATAWLDTLLDVIDLLPRDVIKHDILSIAVAKGQLSQSVQSRLSCCKILGKIATKFEPFVIKKEILPVVQSLCQDVDYEVRSCMCRQLDPVARGLGLESTKSAILPELVELTNDEESMVRTAGIETVVNILTLLDTDTCTSTIIPLVCKFCQEAMQEEDFTLPVLSKQLGPLCHGLSGYLTDEQRRWFLDYYKKLCKLGQSDKKDKSNKETEKDSPTKLIPEMPDIIEEEDRRTECRKNAAFNFPAMVLFIGAKSFKSELYGTFSSLCKDPHLRVRRTMAYGFHEVAKILGTSVSLLQNDLIVLLKDEAIEVQRGIISSLPETLDVLAKGGGHTVSEAKLNSLSESIPAIMAAEVVVSASNDWRLQEELMSNMSCLPRCTTSETMYTKVIPVLFQKLKTARALPVRLASVRTLLIIVRCVKKLDQREELMQRIVDDFCHGRSCHHRSLFIDICRVVIELYSKTFFKEHFFEVLLELHNDPVPNIRLRMCSILPELKRLIKLPSDRNLLQQLELCVRKLLVNEKDKDVSAAIKQAVEELDRIHVQMESLTRRMFVDEDVVDQKKEEVEKKLVEMEEREIQKEEEAREKKEKGRNAASAKKGADNGAGSKIPGPKKGSKTGSSSSHKAEKSGSAGASREIKRTPSTSTSTGTTTSGGVKAATGTTNKSDKTSTSKSARSGSLTVPTPGSASGRRGSTSSVTSTSSSESIPAKASSKKTGNGSIPPSTGTRTKKYPK